ncbi:hypothetical protein [uncultured Winogradskyella sp.]|uniref:hypothetical protein n=1 Tax=uncultured Winogradskyella sp. TaxID=395353 RepID=UPI0026288CBB|nr:hypothetical protein [uncultured Winogradskyella sp.]|tara:strand:- start:11480 stop:12106 length:627 start_codon:yes stop_codon:yes gene_type:complete
MKGKIFQLLLLQVLITSCINESANKTPTTQEVQNETPEVLDDESNYKSVSFSKRYDSDIISQLYKEAMDKNANLEKLHKEIIKMGEIENDSISEYSQYVSVNARYYASAKTYANRIKDSLLKESTIAAFNTIETNYKKKIEALVEKQKIITKKSKALDDQLILMKLYVTESMIRNYQNNEKPDIKTLENIIKKYDSLIKASEKFIHIK